MENKTKSANMQKYENYKEQFKRLNMAMSHNFYLEAIFICYAIMEDRTESILRHADEWEKFENKSKGFVTIKAKINRIKKLAEQRGTIANKCFSDSVLDEILVWKEKRNSLIHALMKQELTTEGLSELALEGKTLARTLTNKSGSFTRAIEKGKKQ